MGRITVYPCERAPLAGPLVKCTPIHRGADPRSVPLALPFIVGVARFTNDSVIRASTTLPPLMKMYADGRKSQRLLINAGVVVRKIAHLERGEDANDDAKKGSARQALPNEGPC